MPHLQDDTAQETYREATIVGSVNVIDSSSSQTEELPIQVAAPNFLCTSDPDVAMANKVSVAVVDSSFESVEQTQHQSLSSPAPRGIIKTVITPSSSIGNINTTSSSNDGVSTTIDTEPISSRKNNAGPILTTVCSDSRLSHSPISVKRRISQIEDEYISGTSKQEQTLHVIRESTYFKYGDSPSTSKSSRPAMIRRGSSLSTSVDLKTCQEKPSKMKTKKVKRENAIGGAVGDSSISGAVAVGKSSTIDAVAVASTMAEMRNKKPLTSPTTSGKKGEDASNGIRQSPPVGHYPHHLPHQSFHPSVVAPPAFHHHPASFAGHPYGLTGGYPMAYPGYPPHAPPGAVPPMMVGQFHGHPAAGFYAPYPPGFHPHPMHQHSGQHLPPFVHPYGHVTGATLSAAKISSNNSSTNAEDKDHKNNQMAVMTRSSSTIDHSANSSISSKSRVVGKPISANRCVPLKGPIPSKHWG